MEIVQVDSQATHREFLRLPRVIYRDDPNWISHIDQDIEAVFDLRKNRYFRYGDADRWILRDKNGETIGRVAAFINEKQSYAEGQPTGGMGFFDCVEDEKAAFALFDQCRMWLEENIGTRINHLRIEQAAVAGPEIVASGCPYCLTMFEDGIKEKEMSEQLRALDVIELLDQSIRGTP